jgi:hypothetical protein
MVLNEELNKTDISKEVRFMTSDEFKTKIENRQKIN